MDLSTAASALSSLENLTYVALFVLFLIEGPIVNYVAAFAAFQGFFNVWIVLLLAILGNDCGDLLYYFAGRIGKKIIKLSKRLIEASSKLTRFQHLRDQLQDHAATSLFVVKITPVLTAPGLILSGVIKMPFWKYLLYCTMINILTCSFFTALGYFSGKFFSVVYDQVKNIAIVISVAVIVVIATWWGVRKLQQKMSERARRL